MGRGAGRLTRATLGAGAALALAACGGAGAATDAGSAGSAPPPAASVDRGTWLASDRARREAIAADFIDDNPQLCPGGLGAPQLAAYVTGSIEAERDDRGDRVLERPVEPVLRQWCEQSEGG